MIKARRIITYLLVALTLLCCVRRAETTAFGEEGGQAALKYLDYGFSGGSDLYVDEEIMAVCTLGGITVYGDNQIYNADMNIKPSDILRVGKKLYYIQDSWVCHCDINLKNITKLPLSAACIGYASGKLYVGTSGSLKSYTVDEESGNVSDETLLITKKIDAVSAVGDNIYYLSGNSLFRIDSEEPLSADFSSEKFVSDNNYIYYIDASGLKSISLKDKTVKTLYEYSSFGGITMLNGNILLTDNISENQGVIKSYDVENGTLNLYVLEADIVLSDLYTGGQENLVILSVVKDKKIYRGTISENNFRYTEPSLSKATETLALGKVEDYYLIDNDGLCLIKKTDCTDITASCVTNFEEKEFFLSSSLSLQTAPDFGEKYLSNVKMEKSSSFKTKCKVEYGGNSFYVVEAEGTEYYLPTSFAVGKLYGSTSEYASSYYAEKSINKRALAIILVASTALFVTAIYFLYANKEKIKIK